MRVVSLKICLSIILFIIAISCGPNNVDGQVYNKILANKLDSVLIEDQRLRQSYNSVWEQYGFKSKEHIALSKKMNFSDSLNLLIVTSIIDQYGWLGKDVVGGNGNTCLYLVIQHSNKKTREKYLPIMREAAKRGKALYSDLAYLEDRVAWGQGKKQIYGTQLGRDTLTGKYFFRPIDDERNVNKRRASIGLDKLESHAREFGFEYLPPKYFF